MAIANCIEQCNRLEESSPKGGKVVPIDRQAADMVIGEYKVLLEELGHKMKVIEAILQDLETFLTFLRRAKESGDDPAMQGLLQQDALQEISLMKEEAKSLDKRLKQVNIDLEDAECGPKMCCEKMVATLDVKEKPAGGSAEEQKVAQTCEVQEEFVWKNSELLKTIQDIHDKIGKIGLKDPTIPAVQQRLAPFSSSPTHFAFGFLSVYKKQPSFKRLAGEVLSINQEKIGSRLPDYEEYYNLSASVRLGHRTDLASLFQGCHWPSSVT